MGGIPMTRTKRSKNAERESAAVGLIPDAYAAFAQDIFAAFSRVSVVTHATDVAEVVWRGQRSERRTALSGRPGR
jgi:hypothetical protein